MVSVCTVPARGGRSCEHFGGYKTINRIPLLCHTWEQDGVLNMIIIIVIEKRYSALSTCNVFISALKKSQWTHVYSDSPCSR